MNIKAIEESIKNIDEDIIALKLDLAYIKSTVTKNAIHAAIWDLEARKRSNLTQLRLQAQLDATISDEIPAPYKGIPPHDC